MLFKVIFLNFEVSKIVQVLVWYESLQVPAVEKHCIRACRYYGYILPTCLEQVCVPREESKSVLSLLFTIYNYSSYVFQLHLGVNLSSLSRI